METLFSSLNSSLSPALEVLESVLSRCFPEQPSAIVILRHRKMKGLCALIRPSPEIAGPIHSLTEAAQTTM